jgi:ABC-type nitrate/sulfonate/bicarbonate transport system substrate-binding protein
MRSRLHWGLSPTGVYSAPVYLALQRGAFGPSGLTVEVSDNITGADYTENLVAGKYDMGHIGTPPLFAALARTDEYVIVGQAVMRQACFYVIAPPAVRSLRDLRGQVIALNKLRTCPHSIVRTLLREDGMTENDVTLRTLVDGWVINEAIGRGEVAAAVNWEPYVSQAERQYGWHVIGDGRTVIDPPNYGYLIYARRSLVADEPQLVTAMVRAYSEAVRYAMAHADEAAATLYGRIPGIEAIDIDLGLRRDMAGWTWDTRLDPAFIDRVMAEMREQAVVSAGFDVRLVLSAA